MLTWPDLMNKSGDLLIDVEKLAWAFFEKNVWWYEVINIQSLNSHFMSYWSSNLCRFIWANFTSSETSCCLNRITWTSSLITSNIITNHQLTLFSWQSLIPLFCCFSYYIPLYLIKTLSYASKRSFNFNTISDGNTNKSRCWQLDFFDHDWSVENHSNQVISILPLTTLTADV